VIQPNTGRQEQSACQGRDGEADHAGDDQPSLAVMIEPLRPKGRREHPDRGRDRKSRRDRAVHHAQGSAKRGQDRLHRRVARRHRQHDDEKQAEIASALPIGHDRGRALPCPIRVHAA
jgi:hypothetical protein